MRLPAKTQLNSRGPNARTDSTPAPVAGWNTRDSQAQMAPQFALDLVNLFPTAKTVTLRKGMEAHASGLPSIAKRMMVWTGVSSAKIFAATDTGIYETTAAGAVGSVSSTITNGKCAYINFSTTGGSFLVVVNGTDSLRYYNGTAWTTVANFAVGSGPSPLLTTDISFLNSFKRSLFFIEKASMNFYYLPVDQITGTVSRFPLGALFGKGGHLVSMGNWTFDGGVGLDDYTVFATSKGQLAVYKGTDPSSSTTWALQGIYDLGEPLGQNCFSKYGGDLLYLSSTGLWSMSKALSMSSNREAATISSVINEAFSEAAGLWGSHYGWEIISSPADNLLIVNVPVTEFETSHQYVMNLNTKAWSKFTNWNAASWCITAEQLYFSTGTTVVQAWKGGLDLSASITAYCKIAPRYLSPRARLKEIKLLRLVMQTEGRFALNVEIDTDFEIGTRYSGTVFTGIPRSRFDTDEWDSATWGAAVSTVQDWLTIGAKEGYVVAPRLRIVSRDATIEWSSIDYAYTVGGIQG